MIPSTSIVHYCTVECHPFSPMIVRKIVDPVCETRERHARRLPRNSMLVIKTWGRRDVSPQGTQAESTLHRRVCSLMLKDVHEPHDDDEEQCANTWPVYRALEVKGHGFSYCRYGAKSTSFNLYP